MVDDSWATAFRLFLMGFGGIFMILVILMFCIQSMSGVVRKIVGQKK